MVKGEASRGVIYAPAESESIANYLKDVDPAVRTPILGTSNGSLDSPSHDDQVQMMICHL